MIFGEDGGAGLRKLDLPYVGALVLLPCTAKMQGSFFVWFFWTAGSFTAGQLKHSRDPILSPSLCSFPAAGQIFLCWELAEMIWSLINSTNSKLIQ